MYYSTSNRHAQTFGFISVFLTGLGITIINPVIPFLVKKYTNNFHLQATSVTLLMSTYALSVFLAAPIIGALSDRYGRRPILIFSLLGSAIGYFTMGLGSSLWILFLGRIIEGISAGEIPAIFAYFADITSPKERTKYFGWISAIAAVGTFLGPSIGGVLTTLGENIPMYAGGVITLFNALYGYFFMPESLPKEERTTTLTTEQLNPFNQIKSIFSFKMIRWLLIAAFLLWIPNSSLQSIFPQFTIDNFKWNPLEIGLGFSIMGLIDILTQAFIMPLLLKFLLDKKIIMLGMLSEVLGYCFIGISTIFPFSFLFVFGILFFSFGDAIYTPSFTGILSKSVYEKDQGRVQGVAQSLQSLARIIGPIIGGQLYTLTHHIAPAIMGILFISYALFILKKQI